MASATIIKYPDGRTETKNILTSFEKNGTSVIAFETDKVDNGHKVVGVSYLSDGMYQNVVDQNKWNEVKGYLVDILHDRMNNDEYRLVPEEVLVTADPYHPLGLRDENLDKIVASYEAFKATKEVSNPVQESPVAETIQTEEVQAAPVENVVAPQEEVVTDVVEETIIPNEPVQVMDAPVIEESVQPVQIEDIPVAPVENVVAPESEIVAPQEQVITDVVEETVIPSESVPVMDAPVVEETIQTPVMETPTEQAPILDPFAIADALDPTTNSVTNEVHEDIVPPIGVDITSTPVDNPVVSSIEENEPIVSEALEEIPVQNEIVTEQVPVQEESIIALPQLEVNVVAPENVVGQESAVKKAYLNGADTIIQQMRDTTEKYLNEINTLQANYIKEMEEMRSEISRNLEEAKGINELSKQTFDKAQSISPIENEEALELTRTA